MADSKDWDMTFVIKHRPHPYTRTTRKQQWVDTRWKAYLESRGRLRDDLLEQMAAAGYVAYQTGDHLSVHITVFTGALKYNNVDLDNTVKGIIDGMQSVVFPNDAWIDELYAIRGMSPAGTDCAVVRIRTEDKSWFPRHGILKLGHSVYHAGHCWLDELGKVLRLVKKHGRI